MALRVLVGALLGVGCTSLAPSERDPGFEVSDASTLDLEDPTSPGSGSEGPGGAPGPAGSTGLHQGTSSSESGAPESGESTGQGMPDEDGPGVFVAVGYSLRRVRSADGLTWTHDVHNGVDDVSKPNLLRGIGANPDGFIAIGTNKAYHSADGIDWTFTAPPGGFLSDVVYGDGVWVAAGGAGRVVRSTDGHTWEDPLTVWAATSFRGVAFGGGVFIAIGDDGVRARSADGVDWDAITIDSGQLAAAAFGGGRYVAVGNEARRVASNDAESWSDDATGSPAIGLRTIIYARDRFWAFGTRLYVSEDGTAQSWEEHDVPRYITGVTYGDSQFVAVGGNACFRSDDGFDWEETASGGPAYWGIAFRPDT